MGLVGWAFPDSREKAGVLNEDYYPGDVGFDPLGLKPTDPAEFAEMQTKELQNGRMGMLAAAGFLAQELVNHKPILETLKLLILLDDSEISKNLGINLPTGDIPTLELARDLGEGHVLLSANTRFPLVDSVNVAAHKSGGQHASCLSSRL